MGIRGSVRGLWRAPQFTIAAAATLALGVGAATAIFSVVHAVLLAPLPYPAAERIVALGTRTRDRLTPRLSGGDFVDLEAQIRSFDAVGYYHGGEVGVQLASRADFAPVYWTSAGLFRVFSTRPLHGRLFQDAEIGAAAVVSNAFASRQFGSAAAAVGQRLSVENQSYEIVGVIDGASSFPSRAEVWLPAGAVPRTLERTAYNYRAVARLAQGSSRDRAQAETDALAGRLAAGGKAFVVTALSDQITQGIRPTLRLLFGAALLVLAIACANTASLLVARAVTRSREVAIRIALGATRAQLAGPLLTESLLLGVVGGALGLALAAAGTKALVPLLPADTPRLGAIHVSGVVVAFAAGIAILTSIVFGLAPLAHALRGGPGMVSSAPRGAGSRVPVAVRLRSALVVAEIGVAFVVLVAAGLLVRSLIALRSVDPGFRSDHTLVMYTHVPAGTRTEYIAAGQRIDGFLDTARRLPGVRAAAAVMGLPGGRYRSNGAYAVGDTPLGEAPLDADFTLASRGYFATLGIPLLRGRDFEPQDAHDAPFVAIVSESLARQAFGDTDPLGRAIRCGLDSPGRPMTIVGVVRDVRRDPPAAAPGPILYMPLAQHPFYANEVQVLLRTAVPPETLAPVVRQALAEASPSAAAKMTTMDAMLADSVATPRFRTGVLILFGGMAALLALAGVYGVMAYVVAEGASELGVRMVLGAAPRDVMSLVLRRAAGLGAAGALGGLVAAAGVSRAMTSLLFEVRPLDSTAFLAAAVALLLITTMGAALPAWRASRIDPVRALRAE